MKLLIKFPTRGRPKKFLKTLVKYLNLLDDKTTEVIVSCDIDDAEMNNEFVKSVLSQYVNVSLHYSDNKSKIEAINNGLQHLEFDIVLLASDDMIPVVKGYDTIIKEYMLNYYPDTDGVLWFNDGYQGSKLNTLCILGKKYYERFGYIYHPDYKSVWCDNEFMDIANILGKQTYIDKVIIRHEHPDWGFGDRDAIHLTNIKNESSDSLLYNERKRSNFYL